MEKSQASKLFHICKVHGEMPIEKFLKGYVQKKGQKKYTTYKCKICHNAKTRVKYNVNKDIINEKRRKYHHKHREHALAMLRKYRDEHKDEYNSRRNERKRKIRLECLKRYSSEEIKCVLCGENHVEFLAIDHINGGGNKHRKEIGGGSDSSYAWLKKNNFPPGFRVLCNNCNFKEHLKQNEINRNLKIWTQDNLRKVVTVKEKGKIRTYVISRKNANEGCRKHHKSVKTKCISHYSDGSMKCACCGCQDTEVLCIDHINGGGRKHFAKLNMKGGGPNFYTWLKKNGYPKEYQVLCFNCNYAKHICGCCPHKS